MKEIVRYSLLWGATALWESGNHQIIFVNTLFNHLATLSDRYSFVPLWKPPFIRKGRGQLIINN
ncbi:MAG: DUF4915 domain-containing protein [Okeania sp. SIO3B5]|uniref:DUF4915 domain-containing protein n=1 Tax=Okeania sp. SIO3B5 TaxID=2607811 RepID=UPI0013FE6985|nr:DUF4915 domain-containing protein [Okeania sp. SIO3B5]NEO57008.1 DUF4915 domain-containing protein [Okeania sp. SIO3B5]